MSVTYITSTANATVKNACLLKQKKERDERGTFLIEGIKMLGEAVSSGMEIVRVFATEDVYKENAELIDGASGELYVVSDAVLEKISEWKTPQGVIAEVRRKLRNYEEILKKDKLFMLVLDGVQDPGNIGTIIRTSEAAGIDLIVTTEGTADCFQPKALRASMGSAFRIPVSEGFSSEELIAELKKNKITVGATSLQGKNIYEADTTAKKLALVFGNEGNGISEAFSKNADLLLRLPMHGKVESLNVAVSAGIIMYLLKK